MTRSVLARPAEILDAVPIRADEQQSQSDCWAFDQRSD